MVSPCVPVRAVAMVSQAFLRGHGEPVCAHTSTCREAVVSLCVLTRVVAVGRELFGRGGVRVRFGWGSSLLWLFVP